ncbi:Aste57867_20960 [Aphanomyces stellatus]|uniref:Aste57867_20960 protein n=1 Tax=Aphanomyces stellatus TaxID=120398 RepID=A0A485LH08_9STRA|nr:hypothetical protein As57867_020892 [Aphanomyces stellatus]VFT97636.1 Aste57867_20960 [Aphanomyces stellatus]
MLAKSSSSLVLGASLRTVHTRILDGGEDPTQHCLLFGLPIVLFNEHLPGYVGAEGFGDLRVNVLATMTHRSVVEELAKHNFKERVFVVMPAQQHAASTALLKYLTEQHQQLQAAGEGYASTPTALETRLRESARLEQRLNDEVIKSCHGQVVRYGQAIQLMHLNSTKYVAVKPRVLSDTERDAMRVELTADGLEDAHFQIESPYAHINPGDEVLLGDDIVFASDTWQVKLHMGKRAVYSEHLSDGSHFYELNGSGAADPDAFFVHQYARHDIPPQCLRGGDIVRFLHCRHAGYLCGLVQGGDTAVRVLKTAADDADGSTSTSASFHSVQGLWQIQHLDLKNGNDVTVDDVCCIRHLASRSFLRIDSSHTTNVVSLTRVRSTACHFKLATESVLSGRLIRQDRPLFFHHVATNSSLVVPSPMETNASNDAVTLDIKYNAVVDKPNAFRLQIVQPHEATESMFLLSLLPQLRGVPTELLRLVHYDHTADHTPNLHDLLQTTKWITHVLSELTAFCDDAAEPEVPLVARQNLLEEMNCMAIVVNVLKCAFQDWTGPLSMAVCLDEPNDSLPTWEDTLHVGIRTICQHCYKLLVHIVRVNPKNALACAAYMGTFARQVGFDMHAETLVRELLVTGKDFLTALPDATVTLFVTMLRERGREAEYVEYLTKLCETKAVGIPSKQTLLCGHLFPANDDDSGAPGVDRSILLHVRTTTSLDLEIQSPVTHKWLPLAALSKSEKLVGRYFLATVRMLAAMCWSRNYISISAVEPFFPRDVILGVIKNHTVHNKMRASFCKLLTAVYIDRLPHEAKTLPRRIFISPTVTRNRHVSTRGPPHAASPHLVSLDDDFFIALKGIVTDTLVACQGVLTPSTGKLLLGVLPLCQQMMSFGCYGDELELKKLLNVLIPLVKHDFQEIPPTPPHSASGPSIADRIRQSITTATGKAGGKQARSFSSVVPSATNTAPAPFDSRGPSKKNLSDGNNSLGANMTTLLKCKLLMCQILSWSLQLSMDCQLDAVVHWFFTHPEKAMSNKHSNASGAQWLHEWTANHGDIASACEALLKDTLFDRLVNEHNLTTSLISLVASDYPALVSASLDLIGSYFNMHRELLKHLEDVIVVPTDAVFEVYNAIRGSASILRLYEETSETWLSTRAGETWREVLASLNWFTDVLMRAADGDDLFQIQTLIRGLRVDDLVLNIALSLGDFLLSTGRTASNKVFLRRQEHLLDCCYRFFVLYGWNHLEAQTKLALHLDFFQTCILKRHMPATVLYVIIRNNLAFCRSVSPSLIEFVVQLIDDRGPVAEYLDILSSLAVCNGIPIKENQNTISLFLMAAHRKQHVLDLSLDASLDETIAFDSLLEDPKLVLQRVIRRPLFENMDDGTRDDRPPVHSDTAEPNSILDRILGLVSQFARTNTKATFDDSEKTPGIWLAQLSRVRSTTGSISPAPQPLLYRFKLFDLLASLTLGENFICEARLQGLLPMDSLLHALERPTLPLPLKCKLLKVLNEAWLNTEQYVTEVAGNQALVRFVCSQPSEILALLPRCKLSAHASAAAVLRVHGHELTYVFESLVPALGHYFHHHCANHNILHKHLRQALQDYVNALSGLAHHLDDLPFTWADLVSPVVLAHTTRLGQMAVELAGVDKSMGFQVQTSERTMTMFVAGRNEPEVHLKFFTKWLHTAAFYTASIIREKKTMLDAFINIDVPPVEAVVERLKNRLSIVPMANMRRSTVIPGLDFKFVVAKLIAHANNSEIRLGQTALHSTLEILVVMEQVSSSSPATRGLLHAFGAPKMIIELYCKSHEKDAPTHRALVLLAISLLRDGNHDAQIQFYELLTSGANTKWFERVEQKLRGAITLVDATNTSTPASAADDGTASTNGSSRFISEQNLETLHVLEMLRLLCEGHNIKFQNLFRQQPASTTGSVNIVGLVVKLFNELVRALHPSTVSLLKKAFETIVEFIQGPCEGNQVAVIDPSEHNGCNFIDMVNVLLSMNNTEAGFSGNDVYTLKYMCTLALVALVEGRTDTLIHERMASLLSIRCLKDLLVSVFGSFFKRRDGKYTEAAFDAELLSPEGRQRDNYIVRMIKIVLGQAHLPPKETDAPSFDEKTLMAAGPSKASTLTSPFFIPSSMTKDDASSCIMLNAGFNIFILFHRLLEVPGIGIVLQSSIVPSETELNDVDEPTMSLNPISAGFRAAFKAKKQIEKLLKNDRDFTYAEAYAFFSKNCASVEVHIDAVGVEEKRLQRFYFPKPPVCAFLTSDMRDSVMLDINRDSPAQKIADLFARSDGIISEMTHRYLMSFAGDKYFTWGQLFSFFFAIILNVLLISCYVDMTDWRYVGDTLPYQSPVDANYQIGCLGNVFGIPMATLVRVFGGLQVIISVAIVMLYAFTYGPLIMLEGWKRHAARHRSKSALESDPPQPTSRQSSTLTLAGVRFDDVELSNIVRSIFFLLRHPVYVYYVVYLFMAIMGFLAHNFLFAFHLFDILLRFPELTIIVHAIAWPWKSLMLSFTLLMIAEYIFAIFGFTFFRSQYQSLPSSVPGSNTTIAECGELLSCFMTTFDQTFKSNGGIGSHLAIQTVDDKSTWGPRLAFDNLFNVVIILIFVNIFFGIIIDTFGDQRNRMEERLKDTIGKCFVCNINRETFDRQSPLGFENHVKNEHYLWNYVFLVAHLRFKSKNEFDGVEQCLWRCIQKEDYSFVPLYHALSLKGKAVDQGIDDGV